MSAGRPSAQTETGSARTPTARSARTRQSILQAAESQFAENGFEATRLEDIAAAAGIRRASIVYYYKDKRALYDAVLAGIVQPLELAIARGLETQYRDDADDSPHTASVSERIGNAVTAWIDFLAARPTFARLLLREVAANPPGGDLAPLAAHIGGLDNSARTLVAELDHRGDEFSDAIDPAHFAAAIAGATVFYAAALPSLSPEIQTPEGTRAHEAHRAEVIRIAQRLLGEFKPAAPRGSA
ncbi:MAG: TetR family transcriptional regulator [Myxococcota bacterium]|nr:TetR family transcriptional regulator [Myxococcota bacterium]